MLFSVGLLMWFISQFFETDEEAYTWVDGMYTVGQIMMVVSVFHFAWYNLL